MVIIILRPSGQSSEVINSGVVVSSPIVSDIQKKINSVVMVGRTGAVASGAVASSAAPPPRPRRDVGGFVSGAAIPSWVPFDRGWGPVSVGSGGPSLDQMIKKIQAP